MADPNPLFDDFLDLDLLGHGESSNDLFSFLLNNEDFNPTSTTHVNDQSSIDLSSLDAFNALSSIGILDPFSATEDNAVARDKHEEQRDLEFLLAHNLQQQQQQEQLELHEQKSEPEKTQSSDAPETPNSELDMCTLVAQLTTPLVAIAEASVPSAVPEVTSETAATEIIKAPVSAEAAANAQIAALLNTSKTVAATSAATKRPSPEPGPSARKYARTEPTTATKTSPAPAATKPVTKSVSTADTTLSAATLQFLLQQQTQTPLVPQLFTGNLTREQIEETLARLLESTKYLLQSTSSNEDALADSEADSDEMDGAENHEQGAGQPWGLKTQPGIKTDDIPSQNDLKKMTSKERRQLRNKISARNFRVRRKEYIGTLEGQVEQHKTEARQLREAVTFVQEENKILKDELETVKRQLAQAAITNASAPAVSQQQQNLASISLSAEDQTLLASILGRSPLNPSANRNLTLTMPRSQSPILTPNLHKDVPNSSSITGSSWKDKTPFLVHRTLVPEILIGEQLLFGQKAAWSKEDDMWDRPWLYAERRPKELSKEEKNPFFVSGVVYELMSSIATAMSLNLLPEPAVTAAVSRGIVQQEDRARVQDYENDRHVDEAATWEVQQDLWVQARLKWQSALAATSSREDADRDEMSQEDPDLLEWLYESLMARLVDMDVQQSTQDHQRYLPFSDVRYA
ncbi:hypothetical protein BGX28_002271 [Mortierella sp. GBA30]|nr:hypothetical protein BGX28_002271 [Mortierella sp. GBA30]